MSLMQIRGTTQIMPLSITDGQVATANKDGAAGVYSMRTIGTGALQAMAGNTRLDTIAAPLGSVGMNSQRIVNAADPVGNQDLTTKIYVDNLALGMDWKDNAQVASIANVVIASPGATINGRTMVASDRVLLRVQTTNSENGIWIWNGAATPMTRALDANDWNELVFAMVAVEGGATLLGTVWRCTATMGGVINTTAVTWSQLPGIQSYVAGNGISIAGTTISAVAANTSIVIDGSGIRVTTTPTFTTVTLSDGSGNGVMLRENGEGLVIEGSTVFPMLKLNTGPNTAVLDPSLVTGTKTIAIPNANGTMAVNGSSAVSVSSVGAITLILATNPGLDVASGLTVKKATGANGNDNLTLTAAGIGFTTTPSFVSMTANGVTINGSSGSVTLDAVVSDANGHLIHLPQNTGTVAVAGDGVGVTAAISATGVISLTSLMSKKTSLLSASFTATAGQTDFDVTSTGARYNDVASKVLVFVHGVYQRLQTHYTILSQNVIRFTEGLTVGDLVDIVYFGAA